MDQETARATAQAYLDAYANADREGLLSLFTEDACFTDPVGTPTMRGKQAIAEFWDKAHKGSTILQPELRRVIVCGNEAILLFTMKVRGAEGGGLDLEPTQQSYLNRSSKRLASISTCFASPGTLRAFLTTELAISTLSEPR